jgi:hypothetical protein
MENAHVLRKEAVKPPPALKYALQLTPVMPAYVEAPHTKNVIQGTIEPKPIPYQWCSYGRGR